MPKETIGRTIGVAAAVCVVCSIFVSSTAVMLKPRIDMNRTIDKKRNVLIAAGIEGAEKLSDKKVESEFRTKIDIIVIDVTTGDEAPEEIDPAKLDERKAAKDPKAGVEIPADKDLAGIKRRSRYQSVYLTKPGSADPRVILPVHGKGLWSTMYGFVALDAGDLTTIKTFAFYEHGETPGLGGEVDNKSWKKLWVGKKAYGETFGVPQIDIVKGTADRESPHEIDGLSGATLTANGVEKLVLYWLGKDGYGKFLERLKRG